MHASSGCPVWRWVGSLACLWWVALAQAGEAGIPILCYHRFDAGQPGSTTVTMPVFEAQLDWLAQHGYRVVSLREALATLKAGAPAAGQVVITVDDGHRSVYTELYPLIQRRRLPVTLFIYPSAISKATYALSWQQLQTMADSGLVDVQSHTLWHPDFRAEKAHRDADDYAQFAARQLAASKSEIEAHLGRPVDLLAWPWGYHDATLERLAARSGYIAAFALGSRPARSGDRPYALPRTMVFDSDRGARFAAIIESTRAQPVSAP